jgi:hypothetical protein
MDQHVLGLLIPVLALAIPAAAVIFRGMERVARLKLDEAKVRQGFGGPGAGQIEELAAQLDAVRHELEDVHARLDFTERLLAQKSSADRVAPPAS